MIYAYYQTPRIERNDDAFKIPICPSPPRPSRHIIEGGILGSSNENKRFSPGHINELCCLFPPIESPSKPMRYKLQPRPSRPLNRRPFKPIKGSIHTNSCPVYESSALSPELQKFKSTIENMNGIKRSTPVKPRPTLNKRHSMKKNTSLSIFANVSSPHRKGSLNKVTSMVNLSSFNRVSSLSRSSLMSRTYSCGNNLHHLEDDMCIMTSRPSSCCLVV